ncbi:MAG: DNA repair protein RecN [Burkholderiales bacterium]
MLQALSIRDFVIVDTMELEFKPGFTVLTGETGAGKSILIDALALTLGERADVVVVRNGAERAEIAAEFDIGKLAPLSSWLRENDLEGDSGVCLMRRVIEANGRSRGFINGHTATVQQLREAGEKLVEIHGQNAHQSLLKADSQRELVDAFGGLIELAAQVAVHYRQWQNLRKRRQEWETNAAAFAAEREQLEWQTRELKALNFSTDEWQTLQADHSRLAHAATLLEAAGMALDALSENDVALIAQLNSLISRFRNLIEHDPGLKEILDVLEPAQIQLQEAVYTIRHYQEKLDLDPERLQQAEQRMDAIHSAARKYRVKPEEIPDLLQKFEARLQEMGGVGGVEELKELEQSAHNAYETHAKKLSASRKKAAKSLSQEVTETMQNIAMSGGEFSVELNALEEGAAYGLEQVEFLVSAHKDLPLRPLAKVASGGELSRISLGIQVVTSKVGAVPTMIFDEVDAGIGGRVAEIVGRLLKKLGKERQVLCITHLPQVAAAGDQQWQVSKSSVNGSVLSRIEVMNEIARIEEIARMLGGVKITETTRKHAAEMLNAIASASAKR